MAQKPVNQELIKRFSAVFRDSGLTQAVFGKRIGQKQNAIAQVLGGQREPSKPMLRAIITEFDISPDWIYGESEEMRKPAHKEAANGAISAEVFHHEIGRLQGRLEALERAFERLGESVRGLLIREPEGSLPRKHL